MKKRKEARRGKGLPQIKMRKNYNYERVADYGEKGYERNLFVTESTDYFQLALSSDRETLSEPEPEITPTKATPAQKSWSKKEQKQKTKMLLEFLADASASQEILAGFRAFIKNAPANEAQAEFRRLRDAALA